MSVLKENFQKKKVYLWEKFWSQRTFWKKNEASKMFVIFITLKILKHRTLIEERIRGGVWGRVEGGTKMKRGKKIDDEIKQNVSSDSSTLTNGVTLNKFPNF